MSVLKNFSLNTKQQLLFLVLLAIGLNFNTLFNDYVLDDADVITENRLVEKGISGIPEIFITDLYYGTNAPTTTLEHSLYRPFTLVVFAIEHQFFGKNPMISHLINILVFALLIVLLYRLFQSCVFREQNRYLAFITCLLFVVHPIHTEVIANVKSRDELITFALLIMSFLATIRYLEKKSIIYQIISLTFFFFALLTRESAVTFVAVVPLFLYFFFNRSVKQSLLSAIPLIVVTICYLGLRFSIVGVNHDIPSLNVYDSPFLYATASEAFATKIFILFKYLGLLFFPYPLSWDYGYNQIPYINFTTFKFISSFVILICLVSYAVFTIKRKSVISFCILYFFVTISLYSNLVVNIATPLSERFLFQSSLAFCIALAFFYTYFVKTYRIVSNGVLVLILILFSIKTVVRNGAWKDKDTLMITDVDNSPNSFRVNALATKAFLSMAAKETNPDFKREYYFKAAKCGEYALTIHGKKNRTIESDIGYAYLGLSDYFKSADYFWNAFQLNPENAESEKQVYMISDILYDEGNKYYRSGKTSKAIDYYKKSLEMNNTNVDAWYNLGELYFKLNDTKNGIAAWQRVIQLDPKHKFNNEFLRNS